MIGHDRVGDEVRSLRPGSRAQGLIHGVEDEPVDPPCIAPANGSGARLRPSEMSIRSIRALSALPPTIPLTATTGTPRARARSTSSRIPGTARIGPIDTIGLDGPMTTARAASNVAATRSLGRDDSMPAKRTSRTSGAWRRWTKYSWKVSQPSSVRTWVRTGASVIGRIVEAPRGLPAVQHGPVTPRCASRAAPMWVAKSRSPSRTSHLAVALGSSITIQVSPEIPSPVVVNRPSSM
jgi:hypothetical protein